MTDKNWPMVPFGEISVNHDSQRVPVKSSDRRRGPYPYYGASGIIDWVDSFIFDGEYLLIAEDGENLNSRNVPIAFMSNGKFWVNNHAHIVTGTSRALTKYLYYAFLVAEIDGFITGSAQPKLSQSNLNRIKIPLPPIETQREIVFILDSIDQKISKNSETTYTLEEMSQALFKSWFVDFDPVVAKSEGRKPFGMSDDIAALFPDSFEESELGAVPKGWKTSAASDLLSILSGGTPKTSTSEYWDGAIPWFSVVDTPAPGEVFVLDTEKKITELGVQKSAATIYPAGTTIITARGTVGNVAMMGRPMAFNQSCYGLQGKEYFDGAYTYFLAKHIVEELKLIAHGSVFDTITRDSFDSIKVCKPPCTVVERFSAAVVLMLEKIKATVKESRTLQAMRNALLPQLLSGEIALEKEMTTQVTEPTAA